MENTPQTSKEVLPFATNKDMERLERNKEVLDRMIDVMTKGEISERGGDLRVLKEIIETSHKLTMDEINLKRTAKVEEDDTQIRAAAVAVIRESMKNRKEIRTTVTLDDKLLPTDLLPHETDIETEALEVDDFIKKFEDE